MYIYLWENWLKELEKAWKLLQEINLISSLKLIPQVQMIL